MRVHRIVATAFHGEPPTPEHVVDHIDTNRHNNRPENLRWLTRLENVLKNPITVKRIELVCGSVDAFLANPSLLRGSSIDPNFTWMRAVTAEEATACKERLELWAKTNTVPAGGALGEWVFQPLPPEPRKQSPRIVPPVVEEPRPTLVPLADVLPDRSPFIMALTPGAAQRKWTTPSEFPYCPLEESKVSLVDYAAKLIPGAVFARNQYSESVVVETGLAADGNSLWVMCSYESSLKPWTLAKVTYENGLYVHANLGSFFHENGARKRLHLAQGLEWTGENTIDDFC